MEMIMQFTGILQRLWALIEMFFNQLIFRTLDGVHLCDNIPGIWYRTIIRESLPVLNDNFCR